MQAHLVDAQTAAVDYVHKREGLLMAPAYAVPRLLDRNGLSLQDFDFYEIHEAFASQVLAHAEGVGGPASSAASVSGSTQPLGSIDRDKLNVHGGSLARRPPVRRDRRADRRQPGEDAAGEGLRPRR